VADIEKILAEVPSGPFWVYLDFGLFGVILIKGSRI
jgi:hypothetical protein